GIQPQEPVTIAVEAEKGASVYLMVRDSRLVSLDQPYERLASQIKSFVHTLSEANPSGWVESSLHEAISPRSPTGQYRSGLRDASLVEPRSSEPAEPVPHPNGMYSLRSLFPTEQAWAMGRTARQPWQLLADQPEMLFTGLLTASDEGVSVVVEPKDVGTLEIDAFVAHHGDWTREQTHIQVVRDPLVRFQVPPFVHPDDRVVGRLHVRSGSGMWTLALERDGEPVTVYLNEAPIEPHTLITSQEQVVSFLAKPGLLRAVVTDVTTQQCDTAEITLYAPGVVVGEARTWQLLSPGDTVAVRDHAHMRRLQVFGTLDQALVQLAHAVCQRSGSGNCEEAAALALAAAVLCRWGDSHDSKERGAALLQLGLERLERMWIRNGGFRIYPGAHRAPDPFRSFYGVRAKHYLELLVKSVLARDVEQSRPVAELREKARQMTVDTRHDRIHPVAMLTSCEAIYLALIRGRREPGLRPRLISLAEGVGGALPTTPQDSPLSGMVVRRAEGAYAAAAYLRLGLEQPRALRLMNQVLGQIDEHGGLYSTLDSVAAMMMLQEAVSSHLCGGDTRLEVDGLHMPLPKALQVEAPQRVRCERGLAAVEVVRTVERNWQRLPLGLSVRVALEKAGRSARRFMVGDVLNLVVVLPQEAVPGDRLWVCLPEALTRVVGAHTKMFSVDFRGQRNIQLPLMAVSATLDERGQPTSQRFAVCVRNTYDEARGANAGWVEVCVAVSV
ncbi:MAG: hypothetical protein AAFX99_27945, partial [Myxococcota bacterium]